MSKQESGNFFIYDATFPQISDEGTSQFSSLRGLHPIAWFSNIKRNYKNNSYNKPTRSTNFSNLFLE